MKEKNDPRKKNPFLIYVLAIDVFPSLTIQKLIIGFECKINSYHDHH